MRDDLGLEKGCCLSPNCWWSGLRKALVVILKFVREFFATKFVCRRILSAPCGKESVATEIQSKQNIGIIEPILGSVTSGETCENPVGEPDCECLP